MTTLADAVARLTPETARAWAEALEVCVWAQETQAAARLAMQTGGAAREGETVPEWLARTNGEQAAWHASIQAAQIAWMEAPYLARVLCLSGSIAEVLAALRARAGVTA